MSSRTFVYVPCMGSIWRLTRVRYVKLLSDAAAGKEWDLDRYGRRLGQTVESVTDLDELGAQARLEDLPEGSR